MDGFFKFVHWGNTGAAWVCSGVTIPFSPSSPPSRSSDCFARNHFDTRTGLGQLAFGMILGGIAGNLTDRLIQSRQHVIDFSGSTSTPAEGRVGFPGLQYRRQQHLCRRGVGLLGDVADQTDRINSSKTPPAPNANQHIAP